MEVEALEILSGASNWKLTVRREAGSIAILRAETCDRRAVLPDTLFGLPVTALGGHALAPNRAAPEGEPVLISCGGGGEWDNRQLQDLTFPPFLERVGDYALLNGNNLKTLRLHDGVDRWGGGALMNCRCLDTLHIVRTASGEGETVAYFAGELSRELDITLAGPDGEMVRLLFPEYTEIYEENCPAHHFDYQITGAGYPYHHCFRQKQLRMKEYDALWRGFLGMEHDGFTALRLAWYRLRYPSELAENAAAQYLAYIRDHAGEAMQWLLTENDTEGLRFLLANTEPDRTQFLQACGLARERQATAALAVLLEEQRRRFPFGLEKSFDL